VAAAAVLIGVALTGRGPRIVRAALSALVGDPP